MYEKTEKILMIKVAITLRLLLARNKDRNNFTSENNMINSYEKIAVNSTTDIRKATVNNAFSGKKKSSMVTIILIVESMGYNMKDFGEQYNKIIDKDIVEFEQKF